MERIMRKGRHVSIHKTALSVHGQGFGDIRVSAKHMQHALDCSLGYSRSSDTTLYWMSHICRLKTFTAWSVPPHSSSVITKSKYEVQIFLDDIRSEVRYSQCKTGLFNTVFVNWPFGQFRNMVMHSLVFHWLMQTTIKCGLGNNDLIKYKEIIRIQFHCL